MINWYSIKEAMTEDAKGAIIGSLIGGGLGAGGGVLFGKNKIVGGLVGGGAGALSGGLAGYGIGRSVRKDRDLKKLELRRNVENVLHKAARTIKYKYNDKYERVPDEDYTNEIHDSANRALNEVNDVFGMYGKEPIDKIRSELYDRVTNGSWMYEGDNGENLPLEKAIYPNKF